MDNYIPSEIEGLIAATSKLKDALVSVQYGSLKIYLYPLAISNTIIT